MDQVSYVLAAYGHIVLPKEANSWLLRRMNTFYLSINCIIALLVAHLIGYAIGLSQTREWWYITLFLLVVLSVNAHYAREETMSMLEFLSSCDLPAQKKDKKVGNRT
jgi:hypothetical protein